ncbi:ABC-three component system protein [Longispora albida]|uniref:ABC-three component system protein n=1 Tax=Longispora albida TaxID=203523 RepID=UPI000372DF92|nr:ABC-three component system protein [Longispora albida]
MLRQLSANDPRFKTLRFHEGLNILVADTTGASADTDSRNSAGKSSMIELLHFLLGGSGDKRSLAGQPELRDTAFRLHLDWPRLPGGLTVQRCATSANAVRLSPRPHGAAAGQLDLGTEVEVPIDEWQHLIERDLFGLPPEHAGISGRTLLGFLMRRARSHAFNEPTSTFPKQSAAEAMTHLAYLLGIDWQLADRYRALTARENVSKQLGKAAADPVLGKVIGQAAELRGQIALAEHRVGELQRQIAAFRVVPEYDNLRDQADELDQRVRQSRNDDVIDRANLADIERSVNEASDPDMDYLESAYNELGIVLGDQVRRSFSEVQAFHGSVVRNRRQYLADEASVIKDRIRQRDEDRNRLGEELAAILRALDEGGALDALTTLQQSLAQERAHLGALRHRFEAAQALETNKRQIKQERVVLQQQMEVDLDERRGMVDEAVVLFNRFAKGLYGPEREAYLLIGTSERSLKIEPHIDSDDSGGIGNMVIFCFDLTISVLAHRARRAPDFLVHDSHLFDGVDERQVARALTLASEICREEQMQYIITLNSDELAKASGRGFDPAGRTIKPRLTDEYEGGGLFGFRFGSTR